MKEDLSLYKIMRDDTHIHTIEVLQLGAKKLRPPAGKYWTFEITVSGLVIINTYEYVYLTNGNMRFEITSTKAGTIVLHPASCEVSVSYLGDTPRRRRIKEHLHQITKEHNSNT